MRAYLIAGLCLCLGGCGTKALPVGARCWLRSSVIECGGTHCKGQVECRALPGCGDFPDPDQHGTCIGGDCAFSGTVTEAACDPSHTDANVMCFVPAHSACQGSQSCDTAADCTPEPDCGGNGAANGLCFFGHCYFGGKVQGAFLCGQ